MEVGSRTFESLALASSMRLAMAVACALHVVLVAIVLPVPCGHHPANPGVRLPQGPQVTTTTTPTLATTPTVSSADPSITTPAVLVILAIFAVFAVAVAAFASQEERRGKERAGHGDAAALNRERHRADGRWLAVGGLGDAGP